MDKKKMKLIYILIFALILFMGATFAWLNFQLKSSKTSILKAGNLSLILDESITDGILIEKAIPVSDGDGLSQDGYTFSLVNKGNTAANYKIYLDDLGLEENETRMIDSAVKYSLTKNGETQETRYVSSTGENPKRVIDLGTIEGNTTNEYILKVWIASTATNEVMGTTFYTQLRVEVEQANIPFTESDMTIDLADIGKTIDLDGEDVNDYTIESSDTTLATIDENGVISPLSYGVVTFNAQNKTTGAKKSVIVTITKTLTATFVKQTGVESLEFETNTCKLSDKSKTTCDITPPTVTTSEGYSLIGWNTDSKATTGNTKVSISENTTLYTIMKKDSITYKVTLNKPTTGVTSLGKDSLECTIDAVYGNVEQATSCKVTLPEINTEEGYTAIGWSEVENATTGVTVGTEIELTSDKNYYAIIKKDAVTLSAKFYRNGATSLDNNTNNEIIKICELEEVYNGKEQATSCTVTSPSIEASEATPVVIGYNENKDAIISTLGEKEEIVLTENVEYYAITKAELKELTATFYRNGAKSLDGDESSDYITKQCNIAATYNGVEQEEGCNIKSPVIVGIDKTPTVLGYSKTSDDHTSIWASGEEKVISENANYYAQTTKEAKTLNVTYKIGDNVASIGKENDTCTIAATYNGETQNESCSLEAPSITPNTGYTSVGWSTVNGDTTGSTSITLTKDEIYYANASANSYTVEYYKEGIKIGSSGVKVGDTLTLTSIETLNGEKEGYTFKGWTIDSTSNTVKYTNKQEVSNLATTAGAVVKLYAVYVDDIVPSCSWSTPGTITTGNTTTLTLTCTDTGSGLSSQTLSTSNFSVSSTTYGSVISVSEPSIVTNGYSYIVTVKGLSSGETQSTNSSFTVSLNENSIKDVDGNYNEKSTSGAVIVTGRSYTLTLTRDESTVAALGTTTSSCTSVGTSTTCSIALTTANNVTITPVEGYVALGWFKTTNTTTTPDYAVGSSVIMSEDLILVAKAQDNTAPTISVTSVDNNSTNLVINFSGSDSQSGISSYIIKYGTTSSLGLSKTANSTETSSVIETDPGTLYYYQVCATNGVGLETCTTTESITTWTGIPIGTYSTGDTITYGNTDWYVVSDNGDTTTLISRKNIAEKETYEEATNSINDLVSNNSVYSNDQTYSALTNASLPTRTAMPTNDSNTPFWTNTATGSNYYILSAEGATTGHSYTKYTLSNTTRYYATGLTSYTSKALATGKTSTTAYVTNTAATSGTITLASSEISSQTDSGYSSSKTSNGTVEFKGSGSYNYTNSNLTAIATIKDSGLYQSLASNVRLKGPFRVEVATYKTNSVTKTSTKTVSYCDKSSGVKNGSTGTLTSTSAAYSFNYTCESCSTTCLEATKELSNACKTGTVTDERCIAEYCKDDATAKNTLLQYYKTVSNTISTTPTNWTTDAYEYKTTSTTDCVEKTYYVVNDGVQSIGTRAVITVKER